MTLEEQEVEQILQYVSDPNNLEHRKRRMLVDFGLMKKQQGREAGITEAISRNLGNQIG